MTTYTVRPVDEPHHALPWREYSCCEVCGLKYPPATTKYLPDLEGKNVLIFPGMDSGLDDNVAVWESLYTALYDLLQIDAGSGLKEGDEFRIKPSDAETWTFQVHSLHVLPLNPPTDIFEEYLRRSEARRIKELKRWG